MWTISWTKYQLLCIPFCTAFVLVVLLNFYNDSICKSKKVYADWTNMISFGEMYGFFSNSVLLLVRLLSVPSKKLTNATTRSSINNMYCFVLAVNLLAGFSALLKYIGYFKGLCEDNLGYC